MDKILGEVVKVTELSPKELVWSGREWRVVDNISVNTDETYLVQYVGGGEEYFLEDEDVMRGWRYLAARRVL